jgi:hypothetical protein
MRSPIRGTPAIDELAASSQGRTDTARRSYDRHCYPRCDDVVAHGSRWTRRFRAARPHSFLILDSSQAHLDAPAIAGVSLWASHPGCSCLSNSWPGPLDQLLDPEVPAPPGELQRHHYPMLSVGPPAILVTPSGDEAGRVLVRPLPARGRSPEASPQSLAGSATPASARRRSRPRSRSGSCRRTPAGGRSPGRAPRARR